MTLHVKKISDQERDFWDQSIVKFPHAHPLNAYGWGMVRKIDGWEPSYFVALEGDVVKGMVMVLHKRIPWTGLSIMYAPKGPVCDPEDIETIKALIKKVKEEGRARRSILLRIDPNLVEDKFENGLDPFIEVGFTHLNYRWSYWNSPRDVYRIELNKVETNEELFNTIDKRSRRRVRKAKRDGLVIKLADSIDELKSFYRIFSKVAVEKGFLFRSYEYQKKLWDEYISRGNGNLFIGVYQEKIVGGEICLNFANKCLAMHIGVLPEYNKLCSNDVYNWESIRWAKEIGCQWYSFRGVGSTPTQEQYKKKFNPQIVSLVGYYDLPLRPIFYRIFYFVELKVLPITVSVYKWIRKKYMWNNDKLKKTRHCLH